jgi:hypothetical protein
MASSSKYVLLSTLATILVASTVADSSQDQVHLNSIQILRNAPNLPRVASLYSLPNQQSSTHAFQTQQGSLGSGLLSDPTSLFSGLAGGLTGGLTSNGLAGGSNGNIFDQLYEVAPPIGKREDIEKGNPNEQPAVTTSSAGAQTGSQPNSKPASSSLIGSSPSNSNQNTVVLPDGTAPSTDPGTGTTNPGTGTTNPGTGTTDPGTTNPGTGTTNPGTGTTNPGTGIDNNKPVDPGSNGGNDVINAPPRNSVATISTFVAIGFAVSALLF